MFWSARWGQNRQTWRAIFWPSTILRPFSTFMLKSTDKHIHAQIFMHTHIRMHKYTRVWKGLGKSRLIFQISQINIHLIFPSKRRIFRTTCIDRNSRESTRDHARSITRDRKSWFIFNSFSQHQRKENESRYISPSLLCCLDSYKTFYSFLIKILNYREKIRLVKLISHVIRVCSCKSRIKP